MRFKGVTLLAACGFVCLLSLTLSARPQAEASSAARQWEHLALTVHAIDSPGDAETSRRIVQFGMEGWELVDVESLVKDGTTMKLVYCFKRPK